MVNLHHMKKWNFKMEKIEKALQNKRKYDRINTENSRNRMA